ncbi:DUF418 domain-containing protein [uncultured Maricaulis sp.]|uniref:DUF418 domain-containing protein n=1 Tax=uncultured Maricaulis sp. TaxID=174710 RepID=UPI0030D8C4EF
MRVKMPEIAPSQRHDSLDALRGFAVLAMLAVNIQLFAWVWISADIPALQASFEGWGNRAVWLVTQSLISQSGATLFAVLFGAALVLSAQAARDNPLRQWPRLSWLLLLGLLHAYLFWFGDLLVPLALVAMIVVTANSMTVRGLWGLGLGLIGFTGLMLLAGSGIGSLIGGNITAAEAMGFNPEAITHIEALYQTGFLARLGYNMSIALQSEMMQIVFMSGRLAGCMLLGMAGVRSGFLTGHWTQRQYGLIAAIALALGVIVCAAGAWHSLASGFSPAAVLQNRVTQYFGSLALALGYAAAFVLAAQLDLARAGRAALAAVGRMPISNYFLQTLLMTFLFVGFPGLGQFGQVDRLGQALIVLSIWVAQVFGSIFWLQRYQYGPVEWLWRSLAAGRVQAWLR